MTISVGDTYTKHGMKRKVVWRVNQYAIAEVHSCGRVINYEAWIIQWHDRYEIGGKAVEAGECPPSTSTWGSNGWTFATLNQAISKIEELCLGGAV